jgi:hypothetical protein
MPRLSHALAAGVSAFFVVACSETTTPPPPPAVLVPSAIEPVTNTTLSSVAGQPLTDSIVARVVDKNGLRLEDVPVTFVVTAGGGTVSPTSAVSREQGIVKTLWTLGPQTGLNRLEVRAEGVEAPLIFEATGTPGAAANFVIVDGDAQADMVGRTLPKPVLVRLTDANGNPIVGAPIDWYWGWPNVSGTITPASAVTNSNGEWSATWQLGTEAGPSQLTVVARPSGMVLGLTATARPEPPTRMTLSEPGSEYEFNSFTVQVRSFDRFGNLSGGLPVTLTPTNGSTVDQGSVTTNVDGNAFASWTMPSAPAGVKLIATTVNSTNADTANAAVIHTAPVRMLLSPDTAFSIPMSFDSTGAGFFNAVMYDKYDHGIPIRFNCAIEWAITPTPPGRIRPQVGQLTGNAYAWSDQLGTYTVTASCPNGLSDTALLIVR